MQRCFVSVLGEFAGMGAMTNVELYFRILIAFLVIISIALWHRWLTGDRKRLVVANELMSGETTSRKAKLVMFPLLLIFLLNFILSIVRWQHTGFSGFTSGTPEPTGYSVVEHGRTFHLTPGEFWLGRIQAIIFVISFVAWFVARIYFLHSGDIKRNKPAA
jgi:hypothetical protein